MKGLCSQGRELFMRMLEAFVLKFKSIAEVQLPVLIQKWLVMPRCRKEKFIFIRFILTDINSWFPYIKLTEYLLFYLAKIRNPQNQGFQHYLHPLSRKQVKHSSRPNSSQEDHHRHPLSSPNHQRQRPLHHCHQVFGFLTL